MLGGQLGVGGFVQLWHSEDNAPFSKAPAEEMRVLDDGLQSWTTIERESLEKVVLGDHAEPDEDVDIPEPLDTPATRPTDEPLRGVQGTKGSAGDSTL